LTASQHGQNLTEAYDGQLERLEEDVTRMAHTQQETETHLTELGHVLSACLAGLEQRSPVPSGPAVGPRTAPSFCSFTLFIYFYSFTCLFFFLSLMNRRGRACCRSGGNAQGAAGGARSERRAHPDYRVSPAGRRRRYPPLWRMPASGLF
jgi:hypothetical protein